VKEPVFEFQAKRDKSSRTEASVAARFRSLYNRRIVGGGKTFRTTFEGIEGIEELRVRMKMLEKWISGRAVMERTVGIVDWGLLEKARLMISWASGRERREVDMLRAREYFVWDLGKL
jgi:hypothetical protein